MTIPTSDPEFLRERLVSHLLGIGKIRSPRIAAAFRTVPRHLFVLHLPVEAAYEDDVIFTKSRQGVSVSALPSPSICADMLEVLDPQPGHAVLEIGAGTGYNAAMVAELVGPSGRVVTIDIDQDIVDAAVANLGAAGVLDRVHVRWGDGGFGWVEEAPYDRVLVTVGAWDIPPAWVDQLVVGGRLVVPLEIHDVHKLITFERRSDHLASADVRECRFVRMRGAFAGPEQQIPLAPTGIYLSTTRPELVDERVAAAVQAAPDATEQLPIQLDPEELLNSFRLWLALRSDDFCLLSLEGNALRESSVRGWAKGSAAFASAPGVLCDGSISLLERDADERPVLRAYGARGGKAARRLRELLVEWHDAGRPFASGLRVRATPLDAAVPEEETEGYVVDRQWQRYVFTPAETASDLDNLQIPRGNSPSRQSRRRAVMSEVPDERFEELEGSNETPVPPYGEEDPQVAPEDEAATPGLAMDEGGAPSAAAPTGLSNAGAGFIARFEGCILHLYNDPANHCTIGIGHLVHHGRCDGRASEAPFRNGITRDRAFALFRQEVSGFAQAVRRHIRVPLNQKQFDALLSWAFNCGAGVLQTSTLARRLNAGDYGAVPTELAKWNKAGQPPRPMAGLTRRRKAEGELFVHGRYE
jgi:protein-L-isoaspartate(D-aspartate) O-methyltransferase